MVEGPLRINHPVDLDGVRGIVIRQVSIQEYRRRKTLAGVSDYSLGFLTHAYEINFD